MSFKYDERVTYQTFITPMSNVINNSCKKIKPKGEMKEIPVKKLISINISTSENNKEEDDTFVMFTSSVKLKKNTYKSKLFEYPCKSYLDRFRCHNRCIYFFLVCYLISITRLFLTLQFIIHQTDSIPLAIWKLKNLIPCVLFPTVLSNHEIVNRSITSSNV